MGIKSITFAGHSSVLFETESLTVAVDPWLEGNPACPQKLKSLPKLDLICLTHGHFDHASEAAALARKHGCAIAAIFELANIMQKVEGVPEQQIISMNKGGSVDFKGLTVTLTHALHSSSYETPQGSLYAGEACGVVLRDGTNSIYHSGDTMVFSDMEIIRELYRPGICLLPVGDHYTMDPKQAALAARMCGARIAIPLHYRTFPILRGTAEQFREACSRYDIQAVALEPGQSYKIP